MPAISVRPVEPSDSEFLLQVYASTRTEELARVPWDDEQRDTFLRMQFEAQDSYWRQQKPNAEFGVVLADGAPAGRLYVDRLDSEIRVVDIALLPEHRGRGIGSALLAEILAEGDRTGLPVTIHVEQGNRARALYERLGFAEVSDTGVYALLERRPRELMGAA